MILNFAQKDKDKAYIANKLWLPKSGVRLEPLKSALEFDVPSRDGQTKMMLWEESSNHLICPREFLPAAHYKQYKFPFVDLRPQFQKIQFKDMVVPRNEEQTKAWNALAAQDNGILNLGCGKGKTKLAVKKIAQKGVPTLVIVPDGGILEQWKEAILGGPKTPQGLGFDGELGIVQGGLFNWAKPITLALVTTLGLRVKDETIPQEMFRYFGLIIYDEVHQIGAPMFSLTAGPFYGDRIGLTATVQREDGLDPIYRYHIGEPFYTDLHQDLVPRIYFQQTPARINLEDAKVNNQVNISVLRTLIGKDLVGNTYRYWCIRQALEQGRKLICLSHSKAQLRLFHSMFPGSGLIVAETTKSERMALLRNTQICFAISRLGSTGVDDDALDTLFWMTPFRSKISLQQSMGRIQRSLVGKKTPVMVVFEDWQTRPLRKLCQALKSNLRTWSFDFDTVPPQMMPSELPPEVRNSYELTFKQLEEEGLEDDDSDEIEREHR